MKCFVDVTKRAGFLFGLLAFACNEKATFRVVDQTAAAPVTPATSESPNSTTTEGEKASTDPAAPPTAVSVITSQAQAPKDCSLDYKIPAFANPYLAGADANAQIDYTASIDTAAANAPILIVPSQSNCFEALSRLSFDVKGQIMNGPASGASEADGSAERIRQHNLGAMFGISNIQTPIKSLIGVFLDDKPYLSRGPAPESLDFSTAELRDYEILAPKLGQLFFIGDGVNSAAKIQSVLVPAGTKRLYLAVMDSYEWNNNSGEFFVKIKWQAAQ